MEAELNIQQENHPRGVGLWLVQMRAPFFPASLMPVLVGSAAGFAAAGTLDWLRFVLTAVGVVALHAAGNLVNEYFDHLSGSDAANTGRTVLFGGSGLLQAGATRPAAVLRAVWIAAGIAAVCGGVLVWMTQSVFILVLAAVGLAGAYFYTAPPLKLGYRGLGEITIALLFGVLAVYGSYYLQTERIDLYPLTAGIIMSLLIFEVILINEFPDRNPDAATGKRTLVVKMGKGPASMLYIGALAISYILCGEMVMGTGLSQAPAAGIAYLLTLPVAAAALYFLDKDTLLESGKYRTNVLTIVLHTLGGLTLTAGFVIQGLIK